MANTTGAIRAGRAFVELFVDANPLTRGLNQAEKQFGKWGKRLQTVGTKLALGGFGTAAGIFALTKAFADYGSQLDDAAHRTGVGTEALSELQYAAELNDATLEDLTKGFRDLAKFQLAAATGGEEATSVLKMLGISLADIQSLSADKKMLVIADALAKIHDVGLRSQLAIKVFGKTGLQLLPMLSLGAKGIQQFRDEARKLGLVMSKEDAAAAAELGDSLDRAYAAVRAITNAVGSAFSPTIKAASGTLLAVSRSLTKWVSENRGLANSLVVVTASVTALGIALTGLGLALKAVSVGFAAFKTVVTAFSLASKAIGSVRLMAIAAVASLLYFSGAGSQALKFLEGLFPGLSKSFSVMYENFNLIFNGILNRLQAGDIKGAWEILTTTLEVAWYESLDNLKAGWDFFSDYLVGAIEVPLHEIIEALKFFAQDIQDALDIDVGISALDSAQKALESRQDDRAKRASLPVNRSERTRDAQRRLGELIANSKPPALASDASASSLSASDLDSIDFNAGGLDSKLKFTTKGTFNPFAVAGLGNSSPAERTAKATETTAKNTKDTATAVKKIKPLAFTA